MAKANAPSTVEVGISVDDAGWALDAMRSRADAYERTAEYLKSERFDGEPFEIENVNDEEEARAIARSYRAVIKRIEVKLSAVK